MTTDLSMKGLMVMVGADKREILTSTFWNASQMHSRVLAASPSPATGATERMSMLICNASWHTPVAVPRISVASRDIRWGHVNQGVRSVEKGLMYLAFLFPITVFLNLGWNLAEG